MGLFGKIWDGVKSVGSAIGSGISKAVKTVGHATAYVADKIVTGVKAGIETVKEVVGNVAEKVLGLGKKIEVVPQEMKTEEISEKITKEGIRPRNENESAKHYLDYLHNEVPFDAERWLSMKDEDKIASKALASALISECITEKTGVELSPEFLLAMEKARLSQEQVSKYIEEYSKRHMKSLDTVHQYFEGKLTDNEFMDVKDTLMAAEKKLNPTKSEEEINQKFVEMRIDYNKANEEWGKLE